jgi:hypothetical protein
MEAGHLFKFRSGLFAGSGNSGKISINQKRRSDGIPAFFPPWSGSQS